MIYYLINEKGKKYNEKEKEMEQLVLKAINGDKDAFTVLILSLQSKLYSIAFSRLKNEADSLDAIQETVIAAYNNLTNLKKPESFENWIISILINECNKIYIKNNKTCHSDIDDYEEIIDFSYINIEQDLYFEDLIKGLNEKEKIIMILYYKNGYSIKDIAKILDMKTSTIKSNIRRAKMKIKKEERSKRI